MAQTEYVIGVYSTAVYEALALHCKPILLDTYGIELMSFLIEKGYVVKSELNEPLNLDELPELKRVDSEYFFGKPMG